MDCHSPGQGLMPASFKVRTIPLDGDDDATEEVLDPDFGEAAIGRVAPVDSGTVYNGINCYIFCYSACSYLLIKYLITMGFRSMVDHIASGIWKMFRGSVCTGEN